ncbi:hypothetical protein CA267_008615 [Alteromonas pelagimontana]|uniref:Transporter substrate-binding domain-containing protein n=1 Tax=Alteromonas pelagimontana TaxID=1858656 RepID=A0A6M4MDB9_9ALTE|nr:hypothetical protein [Alteromonas pelagimontana]QJR80838.1 hypothetical protein CA267_008615 [Alteromonas pelagimontana]
MGLSLFTLLAMVIALGLPRAGAAESEMLISTVNHPAVNYIKPVVTRSYKDLGLEVSYVQMPVTRRLIALNEGLIDGDLAAREDAEDEYENILRVGPPLCELSYILVCPKDVPCDTSVFTEGEKSVYLNRGTATILLNIFGMPAPVKSRYIETPDTLINLFNHNRINYLIYTLVDEQHQFVITREYTTHFIGKSDFYHYIHKRHKNLAPLLADALTVNKNKLLVK